MNVWEGLKGEPFTYSDFTQDQLDLLKGADGKSAYQIWLDAGNSGTLTDFLISLKGSKGDKGDRGPQGNDGRTPIKGVDYFDGAKGDKGNDGYTPIKGIDYFDGAKGDKGEVGPMAEVQYYDGGSANSVYSSETNIDGGNS